MGQRYQILSLTILMVCKVPKIRTIHQLLVGINNDLENDDLYWCYEGVNLSSCSANISKKKKVIKL